MKIIIQNLLKVGPADTFKGKKVNIFNFVIFLNQSQFWCDFLDF